MSTDIVVSECIVQTGNNDDLAGRIKQKHFEKSESNTEEKDRQVQEKE